MRINQLPTYCHLLIFFNWYAYPELNKTIPAKVKAQDRKLNGISEKFLIIQKKQGGQIKCWYSFLWWRLKTEIVKTGKLILKCYCTKNVSYELCQPQISLDTTLFQLKYWDFSLLPPHKTYGVSSVAWLEDRNSWANFAHIQLNVHLSIFKINTVLLNKSRKQSICHVEDVEIML